MATKDTSMPILSALHPEYIPPEDVVLMPSSLRLQHQTHVQSVSEH